MLCEWWSSGTSCPSLCNFLLGDLQKLLGCGPRYLFLADPAWALATDLQRYLPAIIWLCESDLRNLALILLTKWWLNLKYNVNIWLLFFFSNLPVVEIPSISLDNTDWWLITFTVTKDHCNSILTFSYLPDLVMPLFVTLKSMIF